MRRIVVLFVLLGAAPLAGAAAAGPQGPYGEGERHSGPTDALSEEERARIRERLEANAARLRRDGLLAARAATAAPQLLWPVVEGSRPRKRDPNVDGISNFVDQDPAYPGRLLDYEGGSRTYDLPSGYNHRGTDIFTFPFTWAKFYGRRIQVRAGAAGTILGKDDGHFDRNCSFDPKDRHWNAVYVRHDDGSTAWYGHLQQGSLTPKPVGARVAAGEVLGDLGSSGVSTGPHLHIELYDADDRLVDPFSGPFNSMNAASWWRSQPAYRVSRINRLLTHSAPPALSRRCAVVARTNAATEFEPGQRVYLAAYYRDQQNGQLTGWTVREPDGGVLDSWTHASPRTYNASYWYYWLTLPSTAPLGTWELELTFNGTTYRHAFEVVEEAGIPIRVTGVSPSQVVRGAVVEVELAGHGFQPGMGVSVQKGKKDDPKSRVLDVEVRSPSRAVVTLEVGAGARTAARHLVLTRLDYRQTTKKRAIRIVD